MQADTSPDQLLRAGRAEFHRIRTPVLLTRLPLKSVSLHWDRSTCDLISLSESPFSDADPFVSDPVGQGFEAEENGVIQ